MSKQRTTPKKPRRGKTADKPPAPRWQLQTAKARFSEVFRRARSEGPQWITRQDRRRLSRYPRKNSNTSLGRDKQPRSLAGSLPNPSGKGANRIWRARRLRPPG